MRPDIVTDQTSAHDPLHGYCPLGWTVAEWRAKQETDPAAVEAAARALDADPCRGDGGVLERRGADAGLRQQHPAGREGGRVRERLRLPRLRARLYPPAVLQGDRPVPLGGAVGRPRGYPQDRRERERAVGG